MNISRKLNQIAVYWGSPAASGYGGYAYDSPVDIDVRWEEKQELFVNDQGQQELSHSIIYTKHDLDVGGYVYLGEEADLDSSHGNPEIIEAAYRIEAVAKSGNVKGTQYLRKVWTKKYR